MAYKNTQEERVEEFREEWKTAKESRSTWLTDAREDFAFRSGDQWDAADMAKLNSEGRPPITFNRCEAMIEAISGLEINNRQDIRYFPRELGDVQVNEILTTTADWMRDGADAKDEETEAFKDAATCGEGWVEHVMDYDEDPEGKYKVERRDPLMMFPCKDNGKRSYKGMRGIIHAERMDKDEIKEKWPNADILWADDDLGQESIGDGDAQPTYDDDIESAYDKNTAVVLHYQCFQKEPYYRVFDPFQQKNTELSESDFKNLQKNAKKTGLVFEVANKATEGQIPYVKMSKKVYYRGFYCGYTELEWGKSPCQSGFTFKAITGKRDRNKRCWYGIMRVLKDPQRFGNKWLSQILHIINTNAKGGAFVEEGALKDVRKAEEQWASPSPLLLLNEGGIQKIKERTPSAYPTGLDRLMMFAFDSMPFVTGMNLEMLGLAGRDQAGVLEMQRKKAAMAILAPLFNSLKEFRKQNGELLLEYIRKYIPIGKIVRVVGQNKYPQYVEFSKLADTAKFDVVVDESPDSPDFRREVWEGLQQVLPPLMKMGVPLPPEVLQYAPLPADVAQKLAQSMQGPNPQQLQEQIQKMQQMLQKIGQENQQLKQENFGLKTDAQVEMAKVQAKMIGDHAREQGKTGQAQLEAMVERLNNSVDNKVAMFKAMMDKDATERKAFADAYAKIQSAAISASKTTGKSNGSGESDSGSKVRVEFGKAEDHTVKAIEKLGQALDGRFKELGGALTPKKRRRKIKTPEGRTYTVEDE